MDQEFETHRVSDAIGEGGTFSTDVLNPRNQPYLRLLAFFLNLNDEQRSEILNQFRRPVSLQIERLLEIIWHSSHSPIHEFTLQALDRLTLHGAPQYLVDLCHIFPAEQLANEFGSDLLLWAYLNNRPLYLSPNDQLNSGSRDGAERIAHFLEKRGINIALLDKIKDIALSEWPTMSAETALSIYVSTQKENTFPDIIKNPFEDHNADIVPSPTFDRLHAAYEDYWSNETVEVKDRERVLTCFKLYSAHFPFEATIDHLEAIASSGKNPAHMQFLISSLPPHYLIDHFGPEESKNMILWASINYYDCTSPHVDSVFIHDGIRALLNAAQNRWGIDPGLFKQAQYSTWMLCHANVDFELVMANYKLLELHEQLDPSDIPIQEIIARNWWQDDEGRDLYPRDRAYRFGVDILGCSRYREKGPDTKWMKVKMPFHYRRTEKDKGEIFERTFGQTVWVDAPVGLALLYDGVPIATVSYHCQRSHLRGTIETSRISFLICQLQGVRVERPPREGEEPGPTYTLNTPTCLFPNFRTILSEMATYVADQLQLPWVLQGGQNSYEAHKFDPEQKYDRHFRKMTVRGHQLIQDRMGNWIPNKNNETSL